MKKNKANIQDFIEWDTTNWSNSLRYWNKYSSVLVEQAKALEIGAMNGGLSLWLAKEGADVLCSDLNGPSDEAKAKHKKHQTISQIKYAAINALDIPFENHFDIVLFKSVLGGVGRNNNEENQKTAIYQMHKALKDGGELWFAENLIASPMHQFMRKKFVPWGEQWRYVSINEMLGFLDVFSEVKYMTVGFFGAFGLNEFQRKVLGNIDKVIFNKFIPKAWNYIIIGIAKK